MRLAPPHLLLNAHGVTFHVAADDYYIEAETRDGFVRRGLQLALAFADVISLEVMPEDECPGEVLDGGRTRIYLADAC